MKNDNFINDNKPYKALDGKYYASMAEVEQVNNEYQKYKNPIIIDRNSKIFDEPISQSTLDRILVDRNALIENLEAQMHKEAEEEISKSKKL